MTESDLYVKVEHGPVTSSSWRWKIVVYQRSDSSYSYSDRKIKEFHTDFRWAKTLINWKAKRMLRKARERKSFIETEWVIE
jgi:hypothetical protein